MKRYRDESGFTLIEILVVLLILGILATYVGVKVFHHPEQARRTQARIQIEAFESALKTYRMHTGRFPTTEQGLESLISKPETGEIPENWQGPYLESTTVPKDPWGNDYAYRSPGDEERPYEIESYGNDGEDAGEGDDADIESWNIR